MMNPLFYALGSVLLVSLLALVGLFTLGLKPVFLKKILLLLVSFSAGALLGDVFVHLIPEIIDIHGFDIWVSLWVLGGIVFGLITEKVIHWTHCHMPIEKGHVHRFALMNLIGDTVHNFIDGLIIGASYLVSIPLGIATTIAVVFHEIPQEIGDFGVLVHGGFTPKKALWINFLTALSAVVGVLLVFLIGTQVAEMLPFLLAFAAGSFIYIAGSDLIPELHKETETKKVLLQILAFILGIGCMMLLLLVG